MMPHTWQLGIELQRFEDAFKPREHANVVQWNLRSSFPSAMQRGCFLDCLLAFAFVASLYSSNLEIVLGVLWTLRIRSILQIGVSFLSQLDWNMISTMFLLVSSGPSSDTGIMPDRLMKLQILRLHEDLTTNRARRNGGSERRVSGHAKNRVNHHPALIATGQLSEGHSSERSNNGGGACRGRQRRRRVIIVEVIESDFHGSSGPIQILA
nr:Pentatricopeptide repeat-containing protein [Ipomoea batatas]